MATVTESTKLSDVLGKKTAESFAKIFDFHTVLDLLNHVPRRYIRRGELTNIRQLPLGDTVTIVAEVRSVSERPMQRRAGSILEVKIFDGEGFITLTFFNQKWRAHTLRVGDRGMFSGKISVYQGKYQLAHPQFKIFEETGDLTEEAAKAWAEQPVPIYSASGALTTWKIERAVTRVLTNALNFHDALPEKYRQEHGLLEREAAYRNAHQPQREIDFYQARKTLAHYEAFLLQTYLVQERFTQQALSATPRPLESNGLYETFYDSLPFTLTEDQQSALAEITNDLSKSHPMNRLLHGEVGSGKTLVALLGMLIVAQTSGQSALLAPTEVLARQHLKSITDFLGPELTKQLKPTLLTGQMTMAERNRALLSIVSGEAKIVVGTHALFSQKTQFYDLGFVIIDEQHRFGVDQRELLRQKGNNPHTLVLSATPIPRTVAMTVFGDLDISTIKHMPAGRQEIVSHMVALRENPGWEDRIWQRLSEEIDAGRQAFIVVPAIDKATREEDIPVISDDELALDFGEHQPTLHNVEETFQFVNQHPGLKPYRKAIIHGRLSADEKEQTMGEFAAGNIDILVATTVIEVGVNVPNASMMIVLSAERFGIAQLHQLRGRIGRGEYPGIALFVTEAELDSYAYQRIAQVAGTNDGFALAEADLMFRREGDILGSTQSGRHSSLKILSVLEDAEIIDAAYSAVHSLYLEDPELVDHKDLLEAVKELYLNGVEYLNRT